ncbi:MAG: L-fucose:H+ symporter permease [Bacteroidota bacterium]
MVPRKYLLPFIIVTSLFALWGFANDITNPMVSAFKKVLELDNTKASYVQLAFYIGYFCMALPAAIFAKKYSYKKAIIIGLALYAIGALLFYPAASTESFGFFLASYVVITCGLAFLETTASPYVMTLGSEATATQRLNLAQAFNPIGALGGLLVAQQFILKKLQVQELGEAAYKALPSGERLGQNAAELGAQAYAALEVGEKAAVRAADLATIRNPYVILGIAVVGMLILFLVTKMPEKEETDDGLGISAALGRLWSQPRFIGGVIAQAFYVGAQIMCWTYVYQLAESIGITNADAVYYAVAALVIFLIGRWIGTFLLQYFTGGRLLFLFAVGAGVFTLCTIFLPGIASLYCLVGVSLFMSIMFPTIYGIALEGQGEDAKFGAAFLVMAIVGGALMPVLQGKILDIGGGGYTDTLVMGVPEVNFSFILPFCCFVVVAIYGLSVKEYRAKATSLNTPK